MKNGRVASNGVAELPEGVRLSVEAALNGRTFDPAKEPRSNFLLR